MRCMQTLKYCLCIVIRYIQEMRDSFWHSNLTLCVQFIVRFDQKCLCYVHIRHIICAEILHSISYCSCNSELDMQSSFKLCNILHDIVYYRDRMILCEEKLTVMIRMSHK